MALKLDITDAKGVKTRYHKIKSFEVREGKVIVTMSSYVNQTMRDYEKNANENNVAYETYRQETEALQNEVDTKSNQLASDQENEELRNEVVELSNQLNERLMNPDKPVWVTPEDKYYADEKVELDFFEPITFESIYTKLLEDGKYVGSESV